MVKKMPGSKNQGKKVARLGNRMSQKMIFAILGIAIVAGYGYYLVLDRVSKAISDNTAQLHESSNTKLAANSPIEKKHSLLPEKKSEIKREIHKRLENWYNKPVREVIEENDARLQSNPQDVEANWNLAQIHLYGSQDRTKALSYLEKILQIKPDHVQKAMIELWIQILKGNPKQNIAFLPKIKEQEKKITQDHKNPWEYIKLSEMYLAQSMFSAAIKYAKEAQRLGVNNADVYFAISMLLKEDEPVMALKALETVLRLKPNYTERKKVQQEIEVLRKELEQEKTGDINIKELEVKLRSKDSIEKRKGLHKLSRQKSEAAARLAVAFLRQTANRGEQIQGAMILRQMDTQYAKARLEEILYDTKASWHLKQALLSAYRQCGNLEDAIVLEKWLAYLGNTPLRSLGERVIEHLKTRREGKKVGEKDGCK
jgi:tetratricopeptide (TPR) repeat protein